MRISTVTLLVVGYSARSATDLRANLRRPPIAAMPIQYLAPSTEDRAVAVLAQLADRGQHRAPSIRDLLVAATAELCGLTVLHVDKDFDVIARITGQAVERLSLPDPRSPLPDRLGKPPTAGGPPADPPAVRMSRWKHISSDFGPRKGTPG